MMSLQVCISELAHYHCCPNKSHNQPQYLTGKKVCSVQGKPRRRREGIKNCGQIQSTAHSHNLIRLMELVNMHFKGYIPLIYLFRNSY